MIAVEKGLVTLDQNVREVVPELKDLDQLVGFEDHEIGEISRKPIVKKVTTPITLRQLLSHQSGFAYDQLHPGLQEWSKYFGRKEWTMTGSYVGHFLSIFALLMTPDLGRLSTSSYL
jgi:CubicO group peptidase (beta-lactamase class C family)